MRGTFFTLEAIAILVLVYVVISQLIWPAIRGTQFFPWFRRERRLESQIAEAQQKLREQELEKELTALVRKGTVNAAELMRQWRAGELEEGAVRDEMFKMYNPTSNGETK